MAHTFSCFLLSVVLGLWAVTAPVVSARPSPFDQPANVLNPIHADVFERTAGLKVRASTDFSRLSLEEQAHLVYGSDGENGQMLYANMTLYAPNGLKIIMMERFEGLTSALDCKGDDGEMSLTFNSQEAFDYAVKQWSWINEDDSKSFLLVANHDGCGPDAERQAYMINRVTEKPETRTTFLAAVPAPWSDVAGTYDLDFGKFHAPPAVTKRLLQHSRRNLLDDAINAAGEIKDGVVDAAQAVGDQFAKIGDFDIQKSITFDIGVGKAGQKTNIFTDPKESPPRVEVDCVNCFLAGSFQMTGHLSTNNFLIQDLVLNGSPSGVHASLELETILRADGPKGSATPFNATKELFAAGIPGAGIAIPKIFKLGAVISFDVSLSSALSGVGDFTFGLTTSLPDSAHVTTDLLHPERSSQSGFSGSTITPNFQVNTLNGTLTVTAAAVPKLTFGIDIAEIGKIEAGLGLKLPFVETALDALFDQKGACVQGAAQAKAGVKVTSKIGTSLDVNVDATLLKESVPLFEKNLLKLEKDVFEKCFPLGLAGMTPNAPGVTATTTTRFIGPTVPATRFIGPTVPATKASNSSSSAHAAATPKGPMKAQRRKRRDTTWLERGLTELNHR